MESEGGAKAHTPANHKALTRELEKLREELIEFEEDVTTADARDGRITAPGPDDDMGTRVRRAQNGRRSERRVMTHPGSTPAHRPLGRGGVARGRAVGCRPDWASTINLYDDDGVPYLAAVLG
jgi:hypothetical protein